MKIIIEQDMEGIAGILNWRRELVAMGKHDWAMEMMTDEVNAAVEGAFDGGASEVLLLEAHPFVYEKVDPRARISRQAITNIHEQADALFFVGRHAMSGVRDGVLNHTGSSNSIREVLVNGRPFGELGLTAAWFGAQGVPTALVTGDRAACREAVDFCGDVETVSVKEGVSCHEAVSLSHTEAVRRIHEGAVRAMSRVGEFKPFVVEGPVRLEVTFTRPQTADWVSRICGPERLDGWTLAYDAADYAAMLKMYYAMGAMLFRFDA